MAKTPTDKTRINVYLPTTLLVAARVIAKRRGSTYSEIIRTALKEYVTAELRKEKEAS